MILSMTGYGAADCVEDGISYGLSIRTVNNRYLKLNVKLPEALQFLEPEVEKLLRSRLSRGSVLYSLRVKREMSYGPGSLDEAMLQGFVDQMARIRLPDGVQATLDLAGLAQVLEMVEPAEQSEEARERSARVVSDLTRRALDALINMRREEGLALRRDLHECCDAIREFLTTIRERAPFVVEEYHDRLRQRVSMLISGGRLELEADALAREVALFAERCDINEEVSRLTSHLDQFEQTCDRGEQAGRTLEFLSQELLREANTIASKSNDATIARNVVEIKGRIDRLKEQVQNVE